MLEQFTAALIDHACVDLYAQGFSQEQVAQVQETLLRIGQKLGDKAQLAFAVALD